MCRDLRWQPAKSSFSSSNRPIRNTITMRPEVLWRAWTRRRFLMSKRSLTAQAKSEKAKGKRQKGEHSRFTFYFLLFTFAFTAGCSVRFDMQDQPRYKPYKKSDFFSDNRASRDQV